MPNTIIYGSTKTYTHSVGLSCAFRQWRAKSHCRLVHGYALKFSATFESYQLDDYNWVVDFGGLKEFKAWLQETYDHKLLVAYDDPQAEIFSKLSELGLADVTFVPATGCESIALLTFVELSDFLKKKGYSPRVKLVKVEVCEHEGNSAYVRLEQ